VETLHLSLKFHSLDLFFLDLGERGLFQKLNHVSRLRTYSKVVFFVEQVFISKENKYKFCTHTETMHLL
jgi:hypothetical protein